MHLLCGIFYFCVIFSLFNFNLLFFFVFFCLVRIYFFIFMSKKSLIEREKKRRYLFNKYLSLRTFLLGKLSSSVSFDDKLLYSFKIQKLPRNSSSSRLL